MAQPEYGPPPSERWNVNLPAVIGVVFVFLLGVIIWVITSSGSDDDTAASSSSSSIAPDDASPTTIGATSLPAGPATTTPPPMPTTTTATTAPPTTTTTTSTTTTTLAPATTAPGSPDGTVPGDLGIAGHPMQAPPCNDSYITVLASAIGSDATAEGIEAVLDTYPSSAYLRTDQACSSLTQSVDGQPVYVVYFGPFAVAGDACAARADGPADAYARRLSDDVGSDHTVDCG